MVTVEWTTSRIDLVYVNGVLHYSTADAAAPHPVLCAFERLAHGDCDGPILQGEGYVAVMPLGVVHMRHVDIIQIEPTSVST